MPRKSSPASDKLPPLPAESGSYVLEGGEWVREVKAAAEPEPPSIPEDGPELS
jgi:hypothetical protein